MSGLASFLATPINPRKPSKQWEVLPVILEQSVMDRTGRNQKGPHPVGKAEVRPGGSLWVSVADTVAGAHALAMFRDGLLDTVLWGGTVRLRVHNEESPQSTREAWKATTRRF